MLFGLNLYKYDFVGLLMHAEHLEAVHGVGPHTISVPRIVRQADDIDPSAFDNGISDDIFEKIVADPADCCPLYRHDHFHHGRARKSGNRYCIWVFPRSAAAPAPAWAAMPSEREEEDSAQFEVMRHTGPWIEVVRWLLDNWAHLPASAPPAIVRAAPATVS